MKRIAIDINDVIRDYTGNFAKVYKRYVDEDFDADSFTLKQFDYKEAFGFKSRQEFNEFVYVDFPYEHYGCATTCHRNTGARFCDWVENDLTDVEDVPEVLLVSPMELGLTIQSTCFFLSKLPCRVREIYFPQNSATIWDRCDALVTANPNLIAGKPEGKTVFKIAMPYNGNVKGDYEFPSFMELMNDENRTLVKWMTGETAEMSGEEASVDEKTETENDER